MKQAIFDIFNCDYLIIVFYVINSYYQLNLSSYHTAFSLASSVPVTVQLQILVH
jgi:hypothetical protein